MIYCWELYPSNKISYGCSHPTIFNKISLFFCSTWLRLSCTRWVQPTVSSHRPLISNLGCRLSSATSNNFGEWMSHVVKVWKCRNSNPRPLGAKRKCYLCVMRPTLFQILVEPISSCWVVFDIFKFLISLVYKSFGLCTSQTNSLLLCVVEACLMR